jgi:hypothetical protein
VALVATAGNDAARNLVIDIDEVARGFPGSGYARAVLADRPLGYWPLDEASGTAALERTTLAANGIYTGGVALGQPGAVGAKTAVSLDGVDDWIDLGDSTAWRRSTFALSCWVKPEALVSPRVLASRWTTTGDQRSWSLELRADGRLELVVDEVGDGTAPVTITAVTPLAAGAWTHVHFAIRPTVIDLYLNGVLDKSDLGLVPFAASTARLRLGRHEAGQFAKGGMAQVAFFDVPPSAARVAAHYAARYDRMLFAPDLTPDALTNTQGLWFSDLPTGWFSDYPGLWFS